MTREPDPAAVHALVIRTRSAQGLPPTIEDPAILRDLAELFAETRWSALRSGRSIDKQVHDNPHEPDRARRHA